MTITTGSSVRKEQEERARKTLELMPGLEELGLEDAIAEVDDGQAISQDVNEKAPPATPEAIVNEPYLIIRPTTDPSLVFRFCPSLRDIGDAEISFFTSSPKGTAIKLALRTPVPILEILLNVLVHMGDVEVAVQEEVLTDHRASELPEFMRPHKGKVIHVSLESQ